MERNEELLDVIFLALQGIKVITTLVEDVRGGKISNEEAMAKMLELQPKWQAIEDEWYANQK